MKEEHKYVIIGAILMIVFVFGIIFGCFGLKTGFITMDDYPPKCKECINADTHIIGGQLVQIKFMELISEKGKPSRLEPVANQSYQISYNNTIVAGVTDNYGETTVSLHSYDRYAFEIDNKTIYLTPKETQYTLLINNF